MLGRSSIVRWLLIAGSALLPAFGIASAAQAAYLTLGTSNTSNAPTTLSGTSSAGPELWVKNADGSQPAIRAEAPGGAAATFGVLSVLTATSPMVGSAAIRGQNNATNSFGYGVWGSQAGSGLGVYGSAPSGIGVRGASATGTGMSGVHLATAGTSPGVFAATNSTAADATALSATVTSASPGLNSIAVRGVNNGAGTYGIGIYGAGPAYGVYGSSRATAVYGIGAPSGTGVNGTSTNGAGVLGFSSSWYGVRGQSTSGTGVFGAHSANSGTDPGVSAETNSSSTDATALVATVNATSAGLNSEAVRGVNHGTGASGIGVYGQQNGSGYGVYGSTPNGRGVAGFSNSWQGVYGHSGSQAGVVGESDTFDGVWGQAHSSSKAGVSGHNDAGGYGVWGGTTGLGEGVFGSSPSGEGVYGASQSGKGVYGFSATGRGVAGNSTTGPGIYGESGSGDAGYFNGNVTIAGVCTGCAGPALKIDNPIDPAHEYLQHSSVESPDMLDIYDGNVTTDRRGFATVRMPAYFQALNRSFRYQLTVIGKAHWDARAAIWEGIQDNRFTIRTDQPDVLVSWQVTGVRHDPYANAHRVKVVERKPAAAIGKYLHPELYGKSHALDKEKP
jgi:hypothetical protein